MHSNSFVRHERYRYLFFVSPFFGVWAGVLENSKKNGRYDLETFFGNRVLVGNLGTERCF